MGLKVLKSVKIGKWTHWVECCEVLNDKKWKLNIYKSLIQVKVKRSQIFYKKPLMIKSVRLDILKS